MGRRDRIIDRTRKREGGGEQCCDLLRVLISNDRWKKISCDDFAPLGGAARDVACLDRVEAG